MKDVGLKDCLSPVAPRRMELLNLRIISLAFHLMAAMLSKWMHVLKLDLFKSNECNKGNTKAVKILCSKAIKNSYSADNPLKQ